MDWFKIEKGVCQGCMLSPCLFNLYAKYIMKNAGLDDSQARIKSLQSFPASGSFPVSHFFVSGGQSIGVSASASILPIKYTYSSFIASLLFTMYDNSYTRLLPSSSHTWQTDNLCPPKYLTLADTIYVLNKNWRAGICVHTFNTISIKFLRRNTNLPFLFLLSILLPLKDIVFYGKMYSTNVYIIEING